ncbi:MAG: class I SAM-dependent methyltransferase, partial [Candidatus Heimdallarchaeota archaeon]|nr:class I SAM-dependent methyltransferase [Candidatus Heimdallarchaeota archaeon]
KPGDPHYRAYVGPPKNYDLIAAMTFNLLTTLGLRQHNRLLDIGCGSLRVGRLFIPYLNAGNYTGIEPNRWLVEEGITREIGPDLIKIKKPHFLFTDNAGGLNKSLMFNFVVAQSVFSHCSLKLMERWLKEVFPHIHSNGALIATFKQGEKDFFHIKGIFEEDYKDEGWIYPKCPSYREETIKKLAHKVGFKFKILDWKHPGQTWALFSKENFDTSWFDQGPLTWNMMLDSKYDFQNE